MALKGQDLLFLPLRDLKLAVDHLRLCVFVPDGARWVGVVTVEAWMHVSCLASSP